MARYLNNKHVKELIRQNGRRAGKEFINNLDCFVEEKIIQACQVHNGGKKTLDADVAGYIGIKTGGK